jgi:hypothetical protein
MNLRSDWDYVTKEDIENFGGKKAREHSFSESQPIGELIRASPIAVKIGRTVFAHGGISLEWAKRGISELNNLSYLAIQTGDWNANIFKSSHDSPLWFRGYADEVKDEDHMHRICSELSESLAILKVDRMVIGHTPQVSVQVETRCFLIHNLALFLKYRRTT